MATVYIKRNSSFAVGTAFYQKVNDAWTEMTQADFLDYIDEKMKTFGGNIPAVYTFRIVAPKTDSAVTCQCQAALNDRVITTGVTWSVVSGGSYVSIDQNGLLTISTAATGAQVTLTAAWSSFTATHDMTVTYKEGSSSSSSTETVIDESGNTSTTTTTVTENEDGSTSVETSTVITDDQGNTIGTQEGSRTNNADGSYEGTSTSYDENGNPTETTNTSGDTAGNVNTQEIGYDSEGNSAVTSYDIDTSGSENGKVYNGDGVNTEYYAFDMTHGFVMNIHFYINFNQQPAGQDENHHNILAMKRNNPSPWYGFQLRQTGTNKFIILGTQFSTGGNTNTNISGQTTSSANTYEYDLTITYTPSASTNAFVCYNNLTSANVYRSNNKCPDIDDRKYLKVTIGHAMDPNGDPYRYSNITVLNFNISRT